MKFIIALLLAFLAFATADVTFKSSSGSCNFSLSAGECKSVPCAIAPSAVKLIANDNYASGYAYQLGNTCNLLTPLQIELVCGQTVAIASDGKNIFTADCNAKDNSSSSSSTVYVSFTILLLGLLAALL
ncbi:hypothetical protein DICPUDRAFT_148666 [Dictyostelium purpureum]|uniref:Uncharacterized protein n=1 Tax=Dictyostelium purpureum TaxID=5786 RepID=F0ZBP3_DICPU|nr:uncharacterized protein DICPUDRAFT_148666 [Dictyostelium purpureum]EGC38632.1 hypothetical protein DICPUDRAFT_148666 [Dictyostelium purpureum]|eukprot:XP_003284825.1 hypothetical protein DICPUDRAFT_148666 [Dictyostelium purpureum]